MSAHSARRARTIGRGRCGGSRLFVLGVAIHGLRCSGVARARNFQLLAQSGFELVANVRVFAEEEARVFAALAHALAAKAEPGAGFFDEALFDAEIRSEERRVGK